jgi:3-oxoacyl-[acyl-carrier protein] reductase
MADLRHAYAANVSAVVALTNALLPGMVEAGWGRIANVASGIVACPEGMARGG